MVVTIDMVFHIIVYYVPRTQTASFIVLGGVERCWFLCDSYHVEFV